VTHACITQLITQPCASVKGQLKEVKYFVQLTPAATPYTERVYTLAADLDVSEVPPTAEVGFRLDTSQPCLL
jgi:hypothetical protein